MLKRLLAVPCWYDEGHIAARPSAGNLAVEGCQKGELAPSAHHDLTPCDSGITRRC